MLEKLRKLQEHPAVKAIKPFLSDPVELYTVFLIMTGMYYYHPEFCWLYTILAVLVCHMIMKFYDFVARHKYIGPLSYLAYLFAGLSVFSLLVNIGYAEYPLFFLVWFLTPQGVLDFSLWYTLAIYWMMLGFLSSTVYYFSKVRYRMLMQFVIMLIPLTLYAKEGIQMPALLVILLVSSYFLLMVYCRQLREDDTVQRVNHSGTVISVLFYVAAFSILAAIVPKPKITADREYIENVMAQSTLSDTLMNMISGFTQSTDNSFISNNSGRTVYYVEADESLRLRTQTYSYYLADDSWNAIDSYEFDNRSFAAERCYAPADLLEAILEAADADAQFAEKYGLTDVVGTEIPSQREGYVCIHPRFSTIFVPSVTRVSELGDYLENFDVKETRHMILTLGGNPTMDYYYYPDSFARNADVNAVLCELDGASYESLLLDAAEILWYDSDAAALLNDCAEECSNAYAFLSDVHGMDFCTEKMTALAEEITAGCDSDYEKAHAIERYFTEQGFLYDENYRKPEGENIEDFLLTTKRGVCYEYATAMVLLCRAIDLPARYVQGYSMSEQYNGEEYDYVVKVRDAHAFPEVYIAGYGWLGFEPTVAAQEMTDGTVAENHYVMLWGFGFLGCAVVGFAVWLILPKLRERQFRRKLTAMKPEQAASAVFHRMRSIMGLAESVTVMELLTHSKLFVKDAVLFLQLDATIYGHSDEVSAEQLLQGYCKWHEARESYLKEQKLQIREAKRRAKQQRRNHK